MVQTDYRFIVQSTDIGQYGPGDVSMVDIIYKSFSSISVLSKVPD